MPTFRYTAINKPSIDLATVSADVERRPLIGRNFLVPEWGHPHHMKTGHSGPNGRIEGLSLTDEPVSHQERDDRLAIHYFAPIDHTQCVLRGM